jgi:hypothetical protein
MLLLSHVASAAHSAITSTVFRNRNPDAICSLRPTTGGQAAGCYSSLNSEKCLLQSRCTFNAAHARRLRSLLLLHFQLYRVPPPLARAEVRDHNRSIEGTCARDWFSPVTKRCRHPHQPSGGRMTQNITPLFGPTCLGAQTCAPPSGATTLLIVSLGTGVHSPSTLTS